MSSHGLEPRDAMFSVAQKPAVVVQIDEVTVKSPTAEATELISRTWEIGKIARVAREDDLTTFSVPVNWSRTDETEQDASSTVPTASVQRSASHETLWCQKKEDGTESSSQSRRRVLRMQLPSFRSLGIASSDSEYTGEPLQPTDRHPGSLVRPSLPSGRAAAQSLPLPDSQNNRPHNLGSTPLLTPPEDADSIKWNNALMYHQTHLNGGESSSIAALATQVMASTSDAQQGQSTSPNTSQLLVERSRESQDSTENDREGSAQQGGNDGDTPLSKAIRPFISSFSSPEAHVDNIHIIAQVLPQPALNTSLSKLAFEEVVESIQAQPDSDAVAYITLTHAVPPKFEMRDLPTSPPSTPNPTQGRDDYFGQTIFTNAATVSTYHGHKSLLNSQAPRSPNTIVAPSSVHLSVLERYIPPTSAQEYGDLFDSRSHSMLVDRLAELSVRGGRLLLIYPTKTGAKTFMSSYLDPVLDPFLREFIFLNNLYFQLGTTLGCMSAVDRMLEYDGIEDRVYGLCRAISGKSSFRGGPSSVFTVIHSSKGASVIEEKTWKEWFVHQEMARIKENLFEYATTGGRMPPDLEHHQLTPSVLARQVITGIEESRRVSGGVPIELGMFVIERTKA